MRKSILSVLVLASTLSTVTVAANYESSLTLYKQAALFGKSEIKELDSGRFYVEVPSTIMNNSLVVNAENAKVLKKEFKRNDFNRLLKENINKKVKLDEREGILESVNQGLLTLKTDGGVKHLKIGDIESFEFKKNIPLSSGIYEIYTDLIEKKSLNVAYNYLFSGLNWYTNHQLFMDKENNVNYRSDLVVKNNTDLSFENTKLNLMAGDVQIGGNNYSNVRGRMMMADSPEFSSVASPQFESFEGFQKLTYPKPVVVLDNTETHLTFQSFNKIPSEKEYRFNTFHPSTSKNEDVKANMYLILKRKNNKDYHFPFTAGAISVYKGLDPESSTLLTTQSVRDYSKDDDIEISLGKSFDVDVSYTSSLIKEDVKVISNNGYKLKVLKKTYDFNIEMENNEPSEVGVSFNFNNSTSHVGEINLKLNKNTKKEFNYKVTYESQSRLN